MGSFASQMQQAKVFGANKALSRVLPVVWRSGFMIRTLNPYGLVTVRTVGRLGAGRRSTKNELLRLRISNDYSLIMSPMKSSSS